MILGLSLYLTCINAKAAVSPSAPRCWGLIVVRLFKHKLVQCKSCTWISEARQVPIARMIMSETCEYATQVSLSENLLSMSYNSLLSATLWQSPSVLTFISVHWLKISSVVSQLNLGHIRLSLVYNVLILCFHETYCIWVWFSSCLDSTPRGMLWHFMHMLARTKQKGYRKDEKLCEFHVHNTACAACRHFTWDASNFAATVNGGFTEAWIP